MASNSTSAPNDIKVTVKLTLRVPIKSSDDLLTRDLAEIYEKCLQSAAAKASTEKRFSTKLRGAANGLTLAKGSWWSTGPPSPTVSYKNILQYSICPGRPAKVLVLITNAEGNRTELVLIKTKGVAYANTLLSVLQKRLNQVRKRLSENATSVHIPPETRPVHYNANGKETAIDTVPGPVTRSRTTSSDVHYSPMRRTPTDLPYEELEKLQPTPQVVNTMERRHSRHGDDKAYRIDSIPPQAPQAPARTKKGKLPITQLYDEEPNGNSRGSFKKSTYTSDTRTGTMDSVHHYGNASEKLSRPKQKKQKSKAPRELSNLGDRRYVSREIDENNTPWEVNICYIKHDPLVGCVEDESGPIYMYTAHQLVSRDNNDGESGDSGDGSSSSEGGDSDGDSYNSMDGSDENGELERFMMMGRNPRGKIAESITYGTANGKGQRVVSSEY